MHVPLDISPVVRQACLTYVNLNTVSKHFAAEIKRSASLKRPCLMNLIIKISFMYIVIEEQAKHGDTSKCRKRNIATCMYQREC